MILSSFRFLKTAVAVSCCSFMMVGTSLAQERPPLTQDVENAYIGYNEWLYDVRLEPDEKEQLLKTLRRDWAEGSEQDFQNSKNIVDEYDRVTQAAERDAVGTRILRFAQVWGILNENRGQDADIDLILNAYERRHKILAKGHPPLSDEIANARAQYLQFMLLEGSAGMVQIDQDKIKQDLKKSYSSLSKEEQEKTVADMGHWAQMDYDWPTMSEADKNGERQRWRGLVEQMYPDVAAKLPPIQESASYEGGDNSMLGIFNDFKKQQYGRGAVTPERPASTPTASGGGGSMMEIFNTYKKESAKVYADQEAALNKLPANEESVIKPGMTDQEKTLAIQRKMMMDQQKTQIISNMMNMQHQMRMGVIYSMPGAPQTEWVWTSR